MKIIDDIYNLWLDKHTELFHLGFYSGTKNDDWAQVQKVIGHIEGIEDCVKIISKNETISSYPNLTQYFISKGLLRSKNVKN